MSAIELCRTAALGGHVEQCDACGHQRIAYDSCRNRHCPKCQSLARAQWLERRRAELLPEVEYSHVVFTLPEPIAALAWQNKKTLYDMLFRTSAETLRTIAADPKHLGAEIGFITVLHTWGVCHLRFAPGRDEHVLQGGNMTEASGPKADERSHPACWALERLADKRDGREAPAFSWSVTQELVDAGLVVVGVASENGK